MGSKNLCKQGLISHTCKTILVGVAFLVSEILLPSKMAKFPFWPWAIVHGHQKKESIVMGSKFYASRDWYHIHAHQLWWVWPLRFQRYCYLQKRPNFPFWPWTIVHCHKKIQWIRIGSKNSGSYKLMSNACIPILVGLISPVSEILLPSKTTKFPFLTMDYI